MAEPGWLLLGGLGFLVLLVAANLVVSLWLLGMEGRGRRELREALAGSERLFELSQRTEAEAVRAALGATERALAGRAETARLEVQAALAGLTQALAREQGEQRVLLEVKLREMGEQSAARLAEIQRSVTERLAESIEKQMQGSFQRVIDQFAAVQKAMGDVQAVTGQIGDLKRLFSNVKARGGWGEGHLRALLQDLLPAGAWEENKRLSADSAEVVEFVLRMPAKGAMGPLLAVDAKFPAEDYDRLLQASEAGLAVEERAARKSLEARLRSEARKIGSKYILPPTTVDFAVMYLPTDGLYVEATRMPGLIESIGREYRVLVMGPALLPGLVRTLQVGAMSLEIAENAERIQRILGAVRTEFRKIDETLVKLEKQTGTVNRTVRDTRVRTAAMDRQLRGVQALAADQAEEALQLEGLVEEGEPEGE